MSSPVLGDRRERRGQLHDALHRVVEHLVARALDHVHALDAAVLVQGHGQQHVAVQLLAARLVRVVQVADALDARGPAGQVRGVGIFLGVGRGISSSAAWRRTRAGAGIPGPAGPSRRCARRVPARSAWAGSAIPALRAPWSRRSRRASASAPRSASPASAAVRRLRADAARRPAWAWVRDSRAGRPAGAPRRGRRRRRCCSAPGSRPCRPFPCSWPGSGSRPAPAGARPASHR